MKLFDVINGDKKLVLVFEFVEMDLTKFLKLSKEKGGLEIGLLKSLLYQLLKGIEVCHKNKILHRDLKP